jgi:zinc and cadmium transporter
MEAILLSLGTFCSTFFGGLFSIKFRAKMHLIMGFAAGVLIGVFAFDIFPEVIAQVQQHGYDPIYPMVAFVVGFMLFHILEKTILIHHSHEGEYAEHHHPHVGIMSAIALAGHSFMDGVGIGLGFQVSSAVGLLVAIAVISHDFTDGINTVTLLLANKNSTLRAKWFLFLDALTPVLGVASTLFFRVPPYFLTLYLGFFGGFIMYIGASDILPEAHSKHSSFKIIGLTVLGLVFTFLVTRVA